jgi:hypothetical protein
MRATYNVLAQDSHELTSDPSFSFNFLPCIVQNVSIINLKTQLPVGAALKTWKVYADDTLGPDQWPIEDSTSNPTPPVPNVAE